MNLRRNNKGLGIADCGLRIGSVKPANSMFSPERGQPCPQDFVAGKERADKAVRAPGGYGVAALCSSLASSNPQSAIRNPQSGSVLIVVMWIAFGVVGIALYFAHAMEMDLQASENQLAGQQADQAIEGAAVYYSNVLANVMQLNPLSGAAINFEPYMLPQTNFYQINGKVGEATFWFIGRDTNDSDYSHRSPDPVFCLVDEASKANLNNTNLYNNATNWLQNLPQLQYNPNLLAAMYDWNTSNTTASVGGAKNETYNGLSPGYSVKNTNYDTVAELRMVYGMNLDLLYGEDANLNGALDPNENDGMALPPNDNANGLLEPGLIEFFTVYTHEPTNFWAPITGSSTTTITNRVCVTNLTAVASFIETNFASVYSSISQKLNTLATGGTAPTSVIDFAIKSGISEQNFITIEPYLYGSNTVGLININTASAAVLATVPGIGYNYAPSVVAFRQSNPSRLNSVFWIQDALTSAGGTNAILQAGPWITSRSFQYSADIAAVGRHGRGFRRVRFVYDCSSGVPMIVYRQDLTFLGWALGKKIHDQVVAGKI